MYELGLSGTIDTGKGKPLISSTSLGSVIQRALYCKKWTCIRFVPRTSFTQDMYILLFDFKSVYCLSTCFVYCLSTLLCLWFGNSCLFMVCQLLYFYPLSTLVYLSFVNSFSFIVCELFFHLLVPWRITSPAVYNNFTYVLVLDFMTLKS